jgi:hypothetical protein
MFGFFRNFFMFIISYMPRKSTKKPDVTEEDHAQIMENVKEMIMPQPEKKQEEPPKAIEPKAEPEVAVKKRGRGRPPKERKERKPRKQSEKQIERQKKLKKYMTDHKCSLKDAMVGVAKERREKELGKKKN